MGDVLAWARASGHAAEDVLAVLEHSSKRGRPRFQTVVLRARAYARALADQDDLERPPTPNWQRPAAAVAAGRCQFG
eukprot:11216962-Lingulodinium_polyedra.AAC.1